MIKTYLIISPIMSLDFYGMKIQFRNLKNQEYSKTLINYK